MTEGLIVLVLATACAWWLSGARTFAYLLYFASFAPFVTLDLSDGGMQSAEDLGSRIVQVKLVLRALTAVFIVLLVARRRVALRALGSAPLAPVLFFVAWAVLGVAQSSEPVLALSRLAELVLFVLLGVLLWCDDHRSVRAKLRTHALGLLPLIAVTGYYLRARPELAMHVSTDGLVRVGNRLINAETLGTVGALLSLWATLELQEPRERTDNWTRERLLPLACLLFGVAALLFARSRTAMLAAAVGQAILWLPRGRATRRRWIATIALASLVLVACATNTGAIEAWFLRGEGVANLRSGTGRVDLWAHLLDDAVPVHPLLGHGYLSLGEDGRFAHAGSLWTNAHNAYLAALVYCGLPGLAAILAIVVLSIRGAWRRAHARREAGPWSLVLAWCAFAAISNATSFGICGWPNPLMLFFFALYPLAVLGARAQLEESASAAEPHDVESAGAQPA